MSDGLEAAPVAAADPASAARAARMQRFRREQLVVDYLNRGVSVVEIAARVGVGEKRMRAIIREILARRLPEAPEEFAAVQMSRLNEALLVAYSAMSLTNLKAVDQVIRIVRELGRYRGFCAADRRAPLAPRGVEAPALEDLEFAPDAFALEFAESQTVAPAPVTAPSAEPQAAERAGGRPGIPAQSLANVESAPGIDFGADASSAPDPGRRQGSEDAPAGLFASLAKDAFQNGNAARAEFRDALVVARAGDRPSRPSPAGENRPEFPPQDLEKARFAPGKIAAFATAASAAAFAARLPDPPPPGLRACHG